MNSHFEIVEVRARYFEADGEIVKDVISERKDGLWLLPEGCNSISDCVVVVNPLANDHRLRIKGACWYFDALPVAYPGHGMVSAIEGEIDRRGVVPLFAADVLRLKRMAEQIAGGSLAHGQTISFVAVYRVIVVKREDGCDYRFALAGTLDFDRLGEVIRE